MNIVFLGDSLTQGSIGISYVDILKEKLPQHQMINYGKNGDTVTSLYRRMKRLSFDDIDLAFIWVGTNDVLVHVSWSYPIVKTFFLQPWTKTCETFTACYKKIIEMIVPQIKKIFIVSPVFIGEDLHNRWNIQLAELAKSIRSLTTSYNMVDYVDLRTTFEKKLAKKQISPYIINGSIAPVFDELFLKNTEEVDQKSQERGLHFTLDGVHLNSAGAHVVAEEFLRCINNEL
ncbi:MAG: SGNH/GDSL hydrolase family protein [Candidatus Thermoplasmatota archaeon]|nr:SGNH/GDSL hydrolase family protein [Candidatus Thermoplasmatota archaeon]